MAAPDPESRLARRQRLADLALLAVAVAWGITFVVVKEALNAVGPFTFVALRFAWGAAAMAPLVLLGRGVMSRGDILRPNGTVSLARAGSLTGACLFAGYAFQTAGLQVTSAGRAAFITGLSVVIVPILVALVAHQPVGRAAGAGVGLATLGLALLSAEALSIDLETTGIGDLLVLGCAFAFALHIFLLGRFAPRHDVVRLTTVQIITVAALSGIAVAIWEAPAWEGLVAAWPAAAFTGVLCTALAFAVQTEAQRFTTPTHTALIFSTEPVFGALFAAAFAGERFGGTELAGCGLILLGMLVVQLFPARQRPAAVRDQ